MNEFKISEDIYKDSLALPEDSYKISNDIFEESLTLQFDELKQEMIDSYKISDRYWIWKIGLYAYKNFWEGMVTDSEMRLDATGIKYLKSYPTLSALEEAYLNVHPDRKGITIAPAAYYAFANNICKGDIIIVHNIKTGIIGWGTVDGDYMYRPTRVFGCHYRKVIWHKMEMPFIFTNKKASLYQIAKEETHLLKETLIGKVYKDDLPLPFGVM